MSVLNSIALSADASMIGEGIEGNVLRSGGTGCDAGHVNGFNGEIFTLRLPFGTYVDNRSVTKARLRRE